MSQLAINKQKSYKNHLKKQKLERSFLRDRWGNLTKCYWNQMIKEEILKLENNE